MAKIVLFDFDGTIADSKKVYINTIHHSLLEHYYIYPKSHISKALGPKLEISLRNIDKFSPKILKILKDKINREITKKAKSLRLCPYVKETIRKLKERGYKIILLTNSAGVFIKTFLRHNKLLKYFDKLFYAENFPDKESAIRKIAKTYKTKLKDIVYVADRIGDVKVAKNAGCKVMIVLACSWDKNKFRKENYVIRSFRDILFKFE